MVYGEWCRTSEAIAFASSLFFDYSKTLNKCESDILRFLAENGPHSIYDLCKGPIIREVRIKRGRRLEMTCRDETEKLGYTYPYIYKNAKDLEKEGLIEGDYSGRRRKKCLKLTFKGMIVYLLAWREITEEAEQSIQRAILQHPDLLPFSKEWNEIVKIVGKDRAIKSLIESAKPRWGEYLQFEIESENLKFKAFTSTAKSFDQGRVIMFHDREWEKHRNDEFAKFLAIHDELKNAYIAHLAVEDLLSFGRGRLKADFLENWDSEKELAFLEERDIHANPLFPNRLKELFPKFASINYIFTGMLMDKLLWEKSTVKQIFPMEREGWGVRIRISK